MAEFDLSARITGDASGLVQAAAQGETAIEGIGNASKAAATGARDLEQATDKLGTSAKGAAAGNKSLAAAQSEVMRAAEGAGNATRSQTSAQQKEERAAIATAAAEARLAAANNNAERSASAAALAALKLEQAQNRLKTSGDGIVKSANAQSFAVRNVGQQFGDFGLQVASGQDPARAFGQQAGQLGYALSEMGGKLGKVGAFLVGPWGIALTVAAAVAAPFIGKLFEGGTAADEQAKALDAAAQAADSYGNAQSLLGKIIDLTTGKLKTQNAVLIQTIKLQAQANILAAQAEQKTAGAALAGKAKPTFTESLFDTISSAGGADAGLAGAAGKARANALGPLKSVVEDYIKLTNIPNASQSALDKGLDATIRRIDVLGRTGRLAGRDLIEAKQAVLALGTSLNAQKANQLVVDAIDGKGVDPLLKPYARGKKPPKPKKPASTAARDEFGRDAADTISGLVAQFDGTPPVVQKINGEVRKLNDLIDDLNRKKPPGFGKLIADAKEARELIKTGLSKPYDDFIRQQGEGLEVQRLISAGRVDEANALKQVQSLQAQMGPLTDEQRDSVLATVQAMREEGRQVDILREKNAKYVEALGGIKSTVQDATQAFVRGDLGQLVKAPGKLLDAFQTLQGRKLFDSIFGDVFRELEDQVNGTTPVKDAAAKMADAVEKVADKTAQTAQSFANLRPPIVDATNALGSFTSALNSAAGAAGGGDAGGGLTALLAKGNGVTGPGSDGGLISKLLQGNGVTGPGEDGGGDIVVNGRKKSSSSAFAFGDAIGKIGGKIVGAFTNPETGKRIGGALGSYAGKALGGFATGGAIADAIKPLASAIGLKTSKLGGQIGGAIGSFVPIPFGKEIGAVLGSIVGGLFKKSKIGSAGITIGTDGTFQAGATTGNNGAANKAAAGLAGNIAGALNSIADQLGGGLSATPNISVGTKNGKIHVNAVGGRIGVKGSGDIGFGDDEAAAAAYAIQQAIAQGAVTGLSAAVQRALSSNTDVDRGVREALKVKEVETLIGGLGSQLRLQFDAFDKAAADRVRVAKAYGLDVVAIEKINAQQRADVLDNTLKARVASLADFLQSVKFGDLFEGSATDRRKALRDEIAKVQLDAEAGKDGAADKLANLYSQLNATSREAFGTAGGEFTSDRSDSISAIERVLKMETDRVNAAAGPLPADAIKATTDAVNAGNSLTGETNDLLAQLIAATKAGGGYVSGSGAAVDFGNTFRYANLA